MRCVVPRKPLTLYRFHLSGHSHRVELFLSLLGVPVEMAEVGLGKLAANTGTRSRW